MTPDNETAILLALANETAQNVRDLKEEFRHVRTEIQSKSDKESCQRAEDRVAELEKKHSRLYVRVVALATGLAGAGYLGAEWISKLF